MKRLFTLAVPIMTLLLPLPFSGGEAQAAQPAQAERTQHAIDVMDAARELVEAGRMEEAFELYAGLRDAEAQAAAIGRGDPQHFNRLLRAMPDVHEGTRRLLLGELSLAHGRRDIALAHYRTASAALAALSGGMPEYFVDPTMILEAERGEPVPSMGVAFGSLWSRRLPLRAFEIGPGSHRDNWLLRRFIALEAWDDASAEFERLWRDNLKWMAPHVVETTEQGEDGEMRPRTMLVHPSGPDSLTLQFALDYAYFLRQRGDENAASDLLHEMLMELRMAGGNIKLPEIEPVDEEVAADLPRLPLRSGNPLRMVSLRPPARLTAGDFIRSSYGELEMAGRMPAVVRELEQRIDAGGNHHRPVLAALRMHQGAADESLALELEAVDHQQEHDEIARAFQRAQVFAGRQEPARVIEEYRTVLAMLDDVDAEQAREVDGHMKAVNPLLIQTLQGLQEAYSAVGDGAASVAMAQRQLEVSYEQFSAGRGMNPLSGHQGLRELERLAARVETLGGSMGDFRDWLRQQSQRELEPLARANIHWILEDHAAVIEALAEHAAGHGGPGSLPNAWQARFSRLGDNDARRLLAAVVAANPRDFVVRLELYAMWSDPPADKVIEALEQLLQHGDFDLVRRSGLFSDCFEVGYRLARWHVRTGRLDDLRDLALSVSRGEPPFMHRSISPHGRGFQQGAGDHINSLLALAIQQADESDGIDVPMPGEALSVATDGREIWFGSADGIAVLDPATGNVRIHGSNLTGPGRWTRLLVGSRFVWATGDQGTVRYNRQEDLWERVTHQGNRVQLTGIDRTRLWGSVRADGGAEHRPCIIDPVTLGTTVIEVKPDVIRGRRSFTRPIIPVGRDGEGRMIFADRPDTFDDLPGMTPRRVWLRADEGTTLLEVQSDLPAALERWRVLTAVKAPARTAADSASPIVRLDETWPGGPEVHEVVAGSDGLALFLPHGGAVLADEEGLRFVAADGGVERVPGGLPDPEILDMAFDPERRQYWVGTPSGLVRLDQDFRVLNHYTVDDGLAWSRINGVAFLNGKVFLGGGRSATLGGLMVHDPQTGVFAGIDGADGLAPGVVAGLRVRGQQIEVEYALERIPGNSALRRQHPPGLFDPTTGRVRSGGAPRDVPHESQWAGSSARGEEESMAILSGNVNRKIEHGPDLWWLGEQGLVVNPPAQRTGQALMPATLVVDEEVRWRHEAMQRPVDFSSVAELAEALRDDNPFYRVMAMMKIYQQRAELLPVLIEQLDHPVLRVRATALQQIGFLQVEEQTEELVEALRALLGDPAGGIRRGAAIELLRLGHFVGIEIVRELLEGSETRPLLPVGTEERHRALAAEQRLWLAVAPHAVEEIFELMMRNTSQLQAGSTADEKLFSELGEALLRHPGAVRHLLAAGPDHANRGQREFATTIFAAAGPAILPLVHEALKSGDRVVRSNAAFACGAIGKIESVPLLLEALDLES